VNLGHCLEAAGATPKDVMKLTYYIVNYDPNNRPHAALIFEWLGGHRPATALVPVPKLANPKFLFEIEAVAAVRDPALAAPIHRPVPGQAVDFDVVIVGAGLSGLQAAYDLQRAGLRTIVVEARDRVGGKTWSVPTANGKGIVDLGAAWINDTNQERMWALGQKFGLDYVVQNVEGDTVLQGYGRFPFGALPPVSQLLFYSLFRVFLY
jgi:monoamine oxidase